MSDSLPTPTPDTASPSNSSEPKAKPILRSKERDAAQEGDRKPRESKGRGGQGNDQRRGRQDQQEPKARANPALMRGPRPTIPKAVPEAVSEPENSSTPEPDVAEESVAEAE